MRLLAYCIIALSLTLGTIAATTAYVPSLKAAKAAVEAGEPLTLGADAGRLDETDEKGEPAIKPVVAAGERLTAEEVERLERAGVKRVRVKEFSLARWSLGWLFAVAVAGLLAGAGLVRLDRSRRVAAHQETGGPGAAAASPQAVLAAVRSALAGLEAQLGATRDAYQRQHLITDVLGDVQGVHIDAFLASRDAIIARHGLAGFAHVMDRFAAMERQVNRAWSAAADGVLEESEDCVRKAIELVGEVEAAMRA